MMLTDEAQLLQEIEDLSGEVRRLQARARKEARVRSELRSLHREADTLRQQLEIATSLDEVAANPPDWLAPKKKATKKHVGIANLLLSDLHLDENVSPDQIEGMSAYSREIAVGRMQRCFEKFVVIPRDYLGGVQYEGATIWMAGDNFSGNIHEELKETNEVGILESIDFWIDPAVAGLEMAAETYGKVHIVGTVGNHGRMTRKPQAKNRVKDNFDWLWYRQLQRALKHDKRITWNVPESADAQEQVYGWRFLMTHGDQFRGGSGIAGLLSPIMLGDARKRKRQSSANRPYDYMLMGHWHQLAAFRNVIVNGSLKGYDEYSYMQNFDFEPPQQAFWVTTPERGITFSAAIQTQDRALEGW